MVYLEMAGNLRHPKTVIDALKFDRQNGLSIHELMSKYGLSKTTVWHHIHTVKLSKELEQNLKKRQGGSHNKYLLEVDRSKLIAKKLLSSKNRELVIAAAMLYWAEGHKKAFVFTNTDLKMLLVFQKFLIEVLEIPKNSISVLIRTSDPIIQKVALEYWATALSLPSKNLTSNHDNIQNKTRTQYGICRVMVAKSSFYLKVVLSLIELIQNGQIAPVVQRIELRTPNARI